MKKPKAKKKNPLTIAEFSAMGVAAQFKGMTPEQRSARMKDVRAGKKQP